MEALVPNYFTPDMFAIRVDCQILEDLAWQRMGGVMKHLSQFGSQILQISTIQWFLCLFVGKHLIKSLQYFGIYFLFALQVFCRQNRAFDLWMYFFNKA